jgi:hypothetical protein
VAWKHLTADTGSTQCVWQRPHWVHFCGSICQKRLDSPLFVLRVKPAVTTKIVPPATTELNVCKNLRLAKGDLFISKFYNKNVLQTFTPQLS